MEAFRLDDVALRFELKIRNIPQTTELRAKRQLQKRLQEEAKNPSRQSQIVLVDHEREINEVSEYFNDLLELSSISSFEKGRSIYKDVHSRLCHVEGRLSLINHALMEKESAKRLLLYTKTQRKKQKHFGTVFIQIGKVLLQVKPKILHLIIQPNR